MNASFDPPSSQVGTEPELQQSGLGIASLVLAILAIVITTAVFAYAGYVEMNNVGGVGADEGVAAVIGSRSACASARFWRDCA